MCMILMIAIIQGLYIYREDEDEEIERHRREAAKRARQIIDGEMPLVPVKDGEKPLSIAIDEMNQGKMTIIAQDEEEEE